MYQKNGTKPTCRSGACGLDTAPSVIAISASMVTIRNTCCKLRHAGCSSNDGDRNPSPLTPGDRLDKPLGQGPASTGSPRSHPGGRFDSSGNLSWRPHQFPAGEPRQGAGLRPCVWDRSHPGSDTGHAGPARNSPNSVAQDCHELLPINRCWRECRRAGCGGAGIRFPCSGPTPGK